LEFVRLLQQVALARLVVGKLLIDGGELLAGRALDVPDLGENRFFVDSSFAFATSTLGAVAERGR